MTHRKPSAVHKYLLSVLAEEDDRFEKKTLAEAKRVALKEVFRNHERNFGGSEKIAIMYWLKGQGIGVAYATDEILSLLRSWGYKNPKEDTYWSLLTGAILYS